MSASSITLRGRAAAERDMLAACVITRTTGSSADPETGVITPTTATIYTGKCKLQQSAPASGPTAIGEAEVFLGQLRLDLPVTATTGNVAPDDLATMTVSPLDPTLIGKVFHVRGPAHKSYASARRFPVTEVAG